MVTGDEATFRFMYHLIQSNPGQYHWLRIYAGDWHLLYRMVKAIAVVAGSRFSGTAGRSREGSQIRDQILPVAMAVTAV